MKVNSPPPTYNSEVQSVLAQWHIYLQIKIIQHKCQEIQLPSHKLSKAILKCRETVQKLAIQLPSCVTITVRGWEWGLHDKVREEGRERWRDVVKGSGAPLSLKHSIIHTQQRWTKSCSAKLSSKRSTQNWAWQLLQQKNYDAHSKSVSFLKRVLTWGFIVVRFLVFEPLSGLMPKKHLLISKDSFSFK